MSVTRRVSPLDVGVAEASALFLMGAVWFARKGGFDFVIFRRAGAAVSNGSSPFPLADVVAKGDNTVFVYPQPIAYLFAPFAKLGVTAGMMLFLALSTVAILLALRMLDVEDWQIFGVVVLWTPTFSSLIQGTLSPVLLLAAAAGWRWRHSAFSGVFLMLAAGAKLFLWPLLVWLLVTRRFRALGMAALTAIGGVAIWALAEPASLRAYPRLLRALHEGEPYSYCPSGLARMLGFSTVVASAVAVTCAVLGVGVLALLRRRERAGFAAAILVALLASPIVWNHYLLLLAIPLALYYPRLDAMWALPLVLWATPQSGVGRDRRLDSWRILLTLALEFLVAAAAVRRWPRVSSEGPGNLSALAAGSPPPGRLE